MQQERLMFGLAAVLAGIATVEFVLAFIYTPALFAVAVPFAAAAYLVWYHASGRLRDQVERGRAGTYRQVGSERRDDPERGGFGAGPRESYSGRRGGFDAERGGFGPREGRRAGAAGGAGAAGANASGAGGARGVRGNDGPTPSEAYRVLDLDPGADDETVRRAYRERVKSVHPDRDGGDEEEFKRVTEAYEVLRDRS